MSVEILKQIWPEWEIEPTPLGKGSFGAVYKAVRNEHNVESFAAIKIITIPVDPSEIDTLRSEGLDMDASRTYLRNIVDDFVGEIQLMESLKGMQNIVSVEDFKVVEKDSDIGWSIYIRMELLTPFSEYLASKTLSEAEVIKLGCDICTALEICAKRNIIHRDIKPENIFINDFGDFKLGDFGIARKMENLTGGLSQKGTFNYMAPEVANSNEYDARVDIYSLGIVLYRLLNRNRLPFLDDEQLLNPNERRIAVERRLRGEELPPPCEASSEMADLILRACAYGPNKRFASASEMKQSLMDVLNGTYTIKEKAELDGTIRVRKPLDKLHQEKEQRIDTFGTNPTKKRKCRFSIVLISLLVVLGVVCGILYHMFSTKPVSITKQPMSVYANEKERVAVMVEANGNNLSYRWWCKKLDSDQFVKSKQYSPFYTTILNSSTFGCQLYCVITDDDGNSVTTDTVTLNQNQSGTRPVVITQHTKHATGANGETVKISVEATGNDLQYQWWAVPDEVSVSFEKLDASTAEFEFVMSDTYDGMEFVCVVTDADGNYAVTNMIKADMT